MTEARPDHVVRLVLMLALAMGGSSACDDGQAGESGESESGADSSPTNPAVVVAGQVVTPDDYLTYLRVFPAVPEGNVDFAAFREFGNANTMVHGGRIFVEQGGVMQRFDVNENLELIDGPRFSWTDFGIASANASYTVFISDTRAYTFSPQLGVIIVWNPDTIERVSVIELQFPARPSDMETWASDGYVIGDKVVWNVFSGNFETATAYPAVTLAIADAHTDAPPVFVEDPRCLPGGPSFVDANGDYYVHGGGYFGYFFAYGNNPEGIRTCVLRVNAGQTQFDPTYQLDYEAVTGSSVNNFWLPVSGSLYATRAWDPSIPLPEEPDEFWAGAGLRSILVDQTAGTWQPYPALEGVMEVSGTADVVDGISYFQTTQTGYVAGGNADVVELHPDGTRPKFHLSGGFLMTMDRVR